LRTRRLWTLFAQTADASVYLRALGIAGLVYLSAGAAGLVGLDAIDRLPAPPISGTNCIDEKFKFLHETDIRSPDLIAVGSSVTWHSVDIAPFANRYGGAVTALNAAPCYLMVNETSFLIDFYLDNLPDVHTVLSVFAMRDFESCDGPGDFFDTDEARRYIFERDPSWLLYFKNFRPVGFIQDILHIQKMRSGIDPRNTMKMDRFGSSKLLIEPPEIREDTRVSANCFQFVEKTARSLDGRGVQWIVVLLPPMPSWIDAYDTGGARDEFWRTNVASRLESTRAILLDGADDLPLQDTHFTDPAHIHWESVPILMNWILDKLENAGILPESGSLSADAF
jgi:hypothetical protein